jgi:PAS domain-containing protein
VTPVHQRAYSIGGVLQAKVVIVLACAVVIFVGWAGTLERIHYEREDAIGDAVRQNANLAVAFEEHTLRTIWTADQALIFLRHQYENRGEIADLRAMSDAGLLDNALIPNYLVVNAEGRALGKDGRPSELDVSDRDFFAFLRGTPGDRLFISKPFIGRVTGKTVISFSRRMTGPEGAFAGAVSIGLEPAYFLKAYNALDLGAQGLVELVGLDGFARARRVGREASFGQDMRESELLKLAAGAPAGTFVSAGTSSNSVQRYLSYRVLRDYGLVVAVGTAEKEALADFASRARDYYIGATLATALVLLFAAGLLVAQARRDKAEAGLRESEARFRSLTELSSDFYWESDAEHRLTQRGSGGKPSSVALFQSGHQIGKRRWEIPYLSPDEAGWRAHRATLDARQPFRNFEFSRPGDDGSERHISISGDPVFDASGAFRGYRGVGTDITERKRAQLELMEQLDELRRFQKVTVDRELRMMELEAEIRALRERSSA